MKKRYKIGIAVASAVICCGLVSVAAAPALGLFREPQAAADSRVTRTADYNPQNADKAQIVEREVPEALKAEKEAWLRQGDAVDGQGAAAQAENNGDVCGLKEKLERLEQEEQKKNASDLLAYSILEARYGSAYHYTACITDEQLDYAVMEKMVEALQDPAISAGDKTVLKKYLNRRIEWMNPADPRRQRFAAAARA